MFALGGVHRFIGVPEQLLFFRAVLGVLGNADAWLNVEAMAIQAQGLSQDLTDFHGHAVGISRSVDTVQQHHKVC